MPRSPLQKHSARVQSSLWQMWNVFFGARRRIATSLALVFAVMIGYHAVFGQNGLIAYRAKRAQMRELHQQTQELQEDNQRLRSHVGRLGNDPNAIEHEAREALHYTRPGEVIYTLPADSGTAR